MYECIAELDALNTFLTKLNAAFAKLTEPHRLAFREHRSALREQGLWLDVNAVPPKCDLLKQSENPFCYIDLVFTCCGASSPPLLSGKVGWLEEELLEEGLSVLGLF